MSSERVVLGDAAPVCVYHLFAACLFSDPVLPVILVRKAAAGPAENGELYFSESLDNVISYSVGVGDRRVLAHINAVVDASAEMLREMTVYFGVDV